MFLRKSFDAIVDARVVDGAGVMVPGIPERREQNLFERRVPTAFVAEWRQSGSGHLAVDELDDPLDRRDSG